MDSEAVEEALAYLHGVPGLLGACIYLQPVLAVAIAVALGVWLVSRRARPVTAATAATAAE